MDNNGKGITISGSLSSVFLGMNLSDEVRKDTYLQLLGLPVKDDRGNVVGKVTCLDLDNDRWYAKITTIPLKTDRLTVSMEIKE